MKELRISLNLLDQKCSDEHLRSISLFLDWRRVAPHLGLSKRDVEAIEAENRTESERRLEVLQKWKQMYGYKATLKNFVAVLLAVGNADDAEQVCRLLQTPAGMCKCIKLVLLLSIAMQVNDPIGKESLLLYCVHYPQASLLLRQPLPLPLPLQVATSKAVQ